MGWAGSCLHWPESQFWNSTPHYFFACMSTWLDMQDPQRAKQREFAEFRKSVEKSGAA